MDNNQLFKKYYSKLMLEGIIKALVLALIVSFSIVLVFSVFTFLFNYNGLLISILALILITALSAVIFYYKLFKPTTKKVAHRLDRLGLEERLITMMYLEKDESYIAMRQREDAKQKLSTIKSNQVKMAVFKIPVIAVCFLAVLSISMTTISTLNAKGVFTEPEPEPPVYKVEYVTVSYIAGEGGYIAGDAEQIVERGQNATHVMAVADEGFVFVNWSDESANPYRLDTGINSNFSSVATFARAEGTAPQGSGEGEEAEDDDGEGQETPPPGDEDNKDGNDDGGGNESSGRYESSNQIIDGQTYYRDPYLESYYEQALAVLAEGGELSPELRAILETYFKAIQ